MNKKWAILLVGFFFIGTAQARLGESKEELEARYGKSTKLPEKLKKYSLGAECYAFSDETYYYIYYLVENRSVALMLGKNKNKGSLKEEEVEEFLKENSSGAGFKKDQEQKVDSKFTQVYVEPEKKSFAIWEKGAGVMSISTWQWAEKMGEESVVKKYLSEQDIANAQKMIEKERSEIKN